MDSKAIRQHPFAFLSQSQNQSNRARTSNTKDQSKSSKVPVSVVEKRKPIFPTTSESTHKGTLAYDYQSYMNKESKFN